MPWYFPWSEALKKRACRYLLQRYLGQFLQEKLSLDQLTVDLFSGKGTITEVNLDVQALNEIGETYNLPFEIVYGFIGSISVSIPWSSLLSESSIVEVHKLTITVQPKQRSQNASMFDSTWGSMVSSLQLAQECFREEDERELDNSQPFEGVELFAQTIDTVFRRIKVTFIDSVFRIEHVPKLSKSGVAIEICVKRVEYFDEAGTEEAPKSPEAPRHNIYEPVAFSTKKFYLEGTTFYTNEFPVKSLYRSAFHSSSGPKSPNLSPDQHTSTLRDDDDNDASQPILFSRLIGKQEIRLKLKQIESIDGPKVDVEFSMGPVPIFLTPHQLHLLIELFRGLLQPDTDDNRRQWNTKPMGAADFAVVEQELQKRLAPPFLPGESLHQRQGWSSHSLNDSEDEFHPVTGGGTMSSSHISDLSLESSFSHATTDSVPLSNRHSKTAHGGRGRVQELLEDSLTGLTEFRLNCSTLVIVVTHDDVTASPSSSRNSESFLRSQTPPQLKAEKYFEDLMALVMSGHNLRDFSAVREKLSNICSMSHLRLMAAPVVLEGNKKMLGARGVTSVALTVANLELFECLIEKLADHVMSSIYTELLKFSGEVPNREGIILSPSKEPCLRLKIKQQENSTKCRSSREVSTSFKFELTPVFGELDISIVDRLNTLLSPRPLYTNRGEKHQDHVTMQLLDDESNSLSVLEKCDIHISSPLLIVNLRFPIPDLRPVLNMDRSPWWKKNVRREICVIEMTEVTLQTSWSTYDSDIKYEIQCKDSHGLFQENESSVPIPFVRISVDPNADGKATDCGFDWPRLVLTVSPVQMPSLLETDPSEGEDPMCISSLDTLLCQVKAPEISPFSSHEVLYGNETCDKQQDHMRNVTNQVITPGDKDQIMKFIDKTLNNSQYSFSLTLPSVHIYLPDKNFYELLYNRITTDLMLWEPAAPQPVYSADSCRIDPSSLYFKGGTQFEAFSMCKSGIQYDSSSDSEDSSEVYYSTVSDKHARRHRRQSKGPQFTPSSSQSSTSISIAINQGLMTFCTPLQEDEDHSYLGYNGEFQLQVENGTFFIVSNYQGDPEVSYTCLCLNRGSMFHNGMAPIRSPCRRLEPAILTKPLHLHSTLHRSQTGILTSQLNEEASDIFTLVIRVGLDSNCSLRTFQVAVGLKEATLRHRITPAENWLSQLIDFFNVNNYPVDGYKPPPIVTELHLHLQNCAIDYRPLYLPLCALATVDNFNISSNLTAHSTTSLLRIISEELCLYISDKTNTEVLDLRKNYVCVVDTGLVDLLLRRTDGKDEKQPTLDLRASNNSIHIHTCCDSFVALQDLIVYVATDGDLCTEMQSPKSLEVFLPTQQQFGEESHFMDAQEEHVNDLMAEAMHESMYSSLASPSGPEAPSSLTNSEALGEEKSCSSSDLASPTLDAQEDLIDGIEEDYFDNDDEDFCILEDDPGTGIIPPSGEPTVRNLSSDPIQLIENHFTKPVGKTDKFKTPKHFPKPVKRYTLQEMSITWHLYGGHDFQSSEDKDTNTASNMDDIDKWTNETSPKHGVVLNPNTESITFTKIPKSNSGNLDDRHRLGDCLGGTGRSQDVMVQLQMNKVRFQHEIYPENTEQAARQVLLVHDIVIRDRLASSEINKLLYQYTSEALPRQTHAHMLVMKALHIRPDPSHSTSECSLKVSMQPLRLNIDQDTLLFLINFFTKSIESERLGTKDPETNNRGSPERVATNKRHSRDTIPQKNHVTFSLPSKLPSDEKDVLGKKTSPPVFFRSFVFSPEVPIRLDYHGKRVDMEQGAVAGLLMGLAHLNCSEIRLKRICYRHGLLGLDRLLAHAVNEWLTDIKKNQLPSLLGGVGPMYAFVQLFQGIRDLVWLPIEQYRKDGRILLGLQRGAHSFTTSTAMSFLELTNRTVQLIQSTAEFTYDIVSPSSSSRSHSRKKWRRNKQPADLREGVNNAFYVVREGLYDAAQNIIEVASEEHRCKGMPGAVGAILRQIPPSAVKPIILATEATSNVLCGASYQIVPDTRREAVEKWRHKRTH